MVLAITWRWAFSEESDVRYLLQGGCKVFPCSPYRFAFVGVLELGSQLSLGSLAGKLVAVRAHGLSTGAPRLPPRGVGF